MLRTQIALLWLAAGFSLAAPISEPHQTLATLASRSLLATTTNGIDSAVKVERGIVDEIKELIGGKIAELHVEVATTVNSKRQTNEELLRKLGELATSVQEIAHKFIEVEPPNGKRQISNGLHTKRQDVVDVVTEAPGSLLGLLGPVLGGIGVR
jgi:hypothetical protein